MAATIVQITITYFQAASIFSPVTIPNNPKTTCTAGTWKASPVANNKTATKYNIQRDTYKNIKNYDWLY